MKLYLLSVLIMLLSSLSLQVVAEEKEPNFVDKILQQYEDTGTPVPFTSLVLLDARDDISKDNFYAYWRDVHGEVAARIEGLDRTYQQLHLAAVDSTLWPKEGISTVPLPEEHIEGIAFATLSYSNQALDPLVEKRNKQLADYVRLDEQNIFKGTYSFVSISDNSISYVNPISDSLPQGEADTFNVMVLLRKKQAASTAKFRSWLKEFVAPALTDSKKAIAVKLHLLEN